MAEFVIDLITSDDTQQVLDIVLNSFVADEPINKSFNNYDCPDLHDWVVPLILEGCSFKAMNKDGIIIGVFLNHKMSPTEDGIIEEESIYPNCRKINDYLNFIKMQFRLFEIYPECDTALDAQILAVSKNHRGLGIGKALMTKTLDYASKEGFPLCHCLCTSKFTMKICEQMGFIPKYRHAFVDYVVNGNRPIIPEEFHTETVIYVKRL